MNLEFEEIFKISVNFLILNRSYPFLDRTKLWYTQCLIMHGAFSLMFSLLVYSTVYHDLPNRDMTKLCANGTIAVLYGMVTFTYFTTIRHQKLLKDLIGLMEIDFLKASLLPKNEQAVVFEYANKGKSVVKLWLVVASVCAGLFPVKAIILMVYYYIFEEFKFVPVYEFTYPTYLEEIKNDLLPFIVLFLLMVFYAVFAMSMFLGMSPIGPVFILHACGRLEILKRSIQTLFPDGDNYDLCQTNEEFKRIARNLQDVFSFVEKTQTCFQQIYELTLKGTIIGLPITLLTSIDNFHKGKLSLEFITLLIGTIVQSSCLCYYSDLLIEKGEEVRQALYCSGWERHWWRPARSSILIMLTRTSRPVALRSMFGILSLQALAGVFHQAYVIFNLLSAVWNN